MSADAMQSSERNSWPLVSILVPSYNHEKYVIECLESIRHLNYSRLELLVSDDCSLDSTFSLAEQWAQGNAARFERTLVVRQEKNVGIVKNLQFLFDSARGDYLAYIASDDAFVESAMPGRVIALQNNPNIDAIFGNAQLISESGSVLEERGISKRFARELSLSRLLVPSLILTSFVPGPVMMLRREAVLEGGSLGPLPDDLRTEDWYIYFRMAIRGKLRYLNEVVAKYRVMPNSLSRSPSQYKSMIEAVLHVDSIFRYLLTGFNRLLIETRIARWKLELTPDNTVAHRIRKLLLRYAVLVQKSLLFVCAIVLTCGHTPGAV